jgi:hypothetical protein
MVEVWDANLEDTDQNPVQPFEKSFSFFLPYLT